MVMSGKKRQSPRYHPGDKTDAARHGNRQYRAISFPESRSVGNLDNLYRTVIQTSGPLVLHFHVLHGYWLNTS